MPPKHNLCGNLIHMNDSALYLEADEDITSAIDKLGKTAGKTVQIVVPKRSTMLQSVINLKLLKKAAEESGKELVLVTGDRVATDLAARVGLAVAATLGAKAVLSTAVKPAPDTHEDIIEDSDPDPVKPEPVPVKPEPKPKQPETPAKRAPLFARKEVTDHPAEVAVPLAAAVGELEAAAPESVEAAASASKPAPRIPNFSKMLRRVLWVSSVVVVIAAYFVGMAIFETARITLYAAANKVDVDTTFSVDPSATASDTSASLLAGQVVTFSKDVTTPFTPTGTQDAGTKASGTMTIVNNDTEAHDFVTGTRFAAPDGNVFRTTADSHVDAASASIVNHQPVIVASKSSVPVTADANGGTYNEAPAKYTIPGLSSDQQQYTYGQGAQMSGGTTKTVTIVSQSDIDTAQTALLAKDESSAQKSLDANLPAGDHLLDSSIKQTAVNPVSTPALGQPGSTASLALKITYTELAVKQSEFSSIIQAAELRQVGTTNQIYDDGIGSATISPTAITDSGKQTFHFVTEAYDGAKLDTVALAKQIKGKKYGDASDILSKQAGIQRLDMSLSPAWAFSLPGRTSKIKIMIQVANNQ